MLNRHLCFSARKIIETYTGDGVGGEGILRALTRGLQFVSLVSCVLIESTKAHRLRGLSVMSSLQSSLNLPREVTCPLRDVSFLGSTWRPRDLKNIEVTAMILSKIIEYIRHDNFDLPLLCSLGSQRLLVRNNLLILAFACRRMVPVKMNKIISGDM